MGHIIWGFMICSDIKCFLDGWKQRYDCWKSCWHHCRSFHFSNHPDNNILRLYRKCFHQLDHKTAHFTAFIFTTPVLTHFCAIKSAFEIANKRRLIYLPFIVFLEQKLILVGRIQFIKSLRLSFCPIQN